MKSTASYIRFFLLSFFLLITVNAALFSQGTDSRRPGGGGIQKNFCLTVYVNPSKTGITSEEVTGISDLSSTKGSSINGSLDVDYFFSGAAGINFGIGYSGFSSQLSLDNWSDAYTTKDSENETYEMRITGKTIVEDQKIGYLSIPVCLALRFPAAGKVGFYMKTGIGFDIPLVKSYDGTGVFSYEGYYSTYNVVLKDINDPIIGFYTNRSTSSTGTLEVKSFTMALIASGNIFVSLGESIQILLGVHYKRSLSNISTYVPPADFLLSSEADELNSFMAGSSGANVQAVGLSLGLRFYIK